MKNMSGILPPIPGKIVINDTDVYTEDDTEREKLHREIGVAFQSGGILGSMTLGENIALPLQQYTNLPEDEISRIAKMKLVMVNLAGI